MPKILIVKVSSLGDVAHTLPVMADIRRHAPDAQIDWLVEEGFADLVRLVAGVRRVIPFALRRWRTHLLCRSVWREIRALRRTLAAEAYDAVIDCQGLLKTAWIARHARRAGTGVLSGLANRTEGSGYEWPVRFFYDRRIQIAPRTHVVERARQLVAAALGFGSAISPSDTIDFGLDTRAAAHALAQSQFNSPATYAVLLHATSRLDKQWPEPDWIALGRTLAQRGIASVLPWGNACERAASERIAVGIASADRIPAQTPPRLSLPEVVGLLNGAAAVVGVDTGLTHIAAALQRPTIELYNFDTVWRTGAYWSPRIVHLGGASRMPVPVEVEEALTHLGIL